MVQSGRRILLHFALAVAVAVCGSPASAETYHVSPTGDDNSPGTIAAPFRTIGKAAQRARGGDTVLVRAGVYAGGIRILARAGEDRPVVFKADGQVKIAGHIDRKSGFRPVEGAKGVFEVEERGDVAGVAIDLDTTRSVIEGLGRMQAVAEVEAGNYRYCHDRKAGKLYVRYSGQNPEEGHTIHVLRDPQGLYITGSNVIVDGFTICGFARNGIGMDGARNASVRNCRISLCGFGWGAAIKLYRTGSVKVSNCILYRVMNGIMLRDAVRTEVSHNTIYRTRAHGIMLNGGAQNDIRNNILYAGGPSGSCLYVGRDAANGLTLDYNCYLDFASALLITWMPTDAKCPTFWDYRALIKGQDAHSISDYPRFLSVEQDAEDFRLRGDSSCKGRADDGRDMGAIFEAQD